MDFLSFYENNTALLLLIVLWSLPWKGVALWKAAENEQKIWFIVILVTSTFALLDALYIFYFSKKPTKERKPTRGGSTFGGKTKKTKKKGK